LSVFLVGTVRILDADKYAAYAAAIKGLSATFGGEPLVSGSVIDVMEGASPIGERVVVVRFPDADAAKAYLRSPIYVAAKAARAGAADLELRIVQA